MTRIKLIALITMAMAVSQAEAGDRGNDFTNINIRNSTSLSNNMSTTSSATSHANAFAGASSNSVGYGGSTTTTFEAADFGDLRIVPPAIAPSVNTNIICPMVMQGSKAGSVFFFSGSGTHAPDIVPLCVAWHLGQKDVVEQMTCRASKEYRDANPACGE